MPNPWSKTYAADDDWQTSDAYLPFVRAINERIRVAGEAGLFPESLAGAHALSGTGTGGPANHGWPQMIYRLNQLAAVYIDRDKEPEGRYVSGGPDGTEPFDPIYYKLSQRPAWPGENGWPRRYERCVSTLAADGEDGQRARFLASFSPGVVDPAAPLGVGGFFPTLPTTPAGERQHGTKVVERVAGAWVVAADQTAAPDVVEAWGDPRPGDLFGPHVLNAIRDAVNDLRTVGFIGGAYGARSTFAQYYPASGYTGTPNTSGDAMDGAEAAPQTPAPPLPPLELADPEEHLPTGPADCYTRVSSTGDNTGIGTGYRPLVWGAEVHRAENVPFIGTNGEDASFPDGLAITYRTDGTTPHVRRVRCYVACSKPDPYGNGGVGGPGALLAYDDQGTGYPELQLHLNADPLTDAATFVGEVIGDVSEAPARPTPGTPSGDDVNTSAKGFVPKIVPYLFLDYAVAGGFEYTADSP
ncbi:MAG: hypothetical protein JWO31_1283 [Phycisphaerales bacterium]|nr:hypothetical protein [Phycisphaerales bacterium]